jgi:hypothetical protein
MLGCDNLKRVDIVRVAAKARYGVELSTKKLSKNM